MFGNVLGSIAKIFGGSAQERSLKELQPIVEEINTRFQSFASLSHDELRGKTNEFRQRIADYLKDIDTEIQEKNEKVESLSNEAVLEKEEIYEEITNLEKSRDEQLEEILEELLPEAFAVVKESARRFTENESIESTATELDRELATEFQNIRVEGDKVFYSNEWEAAGGMIKWNMVHYDVQLIGGIALHQGNIAEMSTGEGKTLVSTLPAYLNALGDRGVHMVTVNDYLARRDAEWNAPLFNFLGLTVDCLEYHSPNSSARRDAYKANITYGTNNEFGFDYLRDNMSHQPDELVQQKHHYAIIDEVDSVLIDDARTPLIISGPTPKGDIQQFDALKPRIQQLVEAQKKYAVSSLSEAKKLIAAGNDGPKEGEGGLALFRAHRALPKNKALIKFLGEPGMRSLLTKTESYYLQDQQKEMPKADAPLFFTIDEKSNSVDLTEKGIELITKAGEDSDFFILPDVGGEIARIEKESVEESQKLEMKNQLMQDFSEKSERIHSVQQLLKAYTMFERDIEYILQDNKVKIVDEQTGRVMDGRRYSDGLHQAIEAKENVRVEAATQTYATITLQNYFRMYHKLSGMTGTAETEAQELWDIYKLGVKLIPTNKPIIRDDRDDLVYKTKREKYNAVIDLVKEFVEKDRPVLVGTTNVEVSEVLSKMLKLRGVKHNVLNAKQHQKEAEIVAEAGNPGAVTIATNMAGRGTDIKISEEVKQAGGLAIIGTERHESRRVDRQLRGRAGRQGDPGSSVFFVSLEDDLMRIFGSEKVANFMDKFGYKEGDVIEHSWMTKTIERNQKRVEQNNFGIRKRLLEYDDVMNQQRTGIYRIRRNALFGDKLSIDLRNMLGNWCEEIVGHFKELGSYQEFEMDVIRTVAMAPPFDEEAFLNQDESNLADHLFESLSQQYNEKTKAMSEQAYPVFSQIRAAQGEKIENVVVPLTDGTQQYQITVPMQKALDSQCMSMIRDLEKSFTLQSIDEEWKEHLRELDDLKQSTSNAQYEQKDPLLIYKIESFELYGQMLQRLNQKIIGTLYKTRIYAEGEVSEAKASARQRAPKTIESKDEIQSSMDANQQAIESSAPKAPRAPIRSEIKVGRNEPCPCGSGKKFKQCHGRA